MTITYPTTPKFRDITLRNVDPTIVFRAQSGKRIARKVAGQRWEFTLTYPPLKRTDFAPVLGAISKARGAFETFTIVPPNLATPEGTQTADTTVSANKAAGVTAVDISGAGAGNTFKAGDLLKFSNHTKVYMITDDATADGGGLATLNIVPPLLTSIVASTTTVKHSSVPITLSLRGEIQEIQTAVNGFYTYEIDVEESF